MGVTLARRPSMTRIVDAVRNQSEVNGKGWDDILDYWTDAEIATVLHAHRVTTVYEALNTIDQCVMFARIDAQTERPTVAQHPYAAVIIGAVLVAMAALTLGALQMHRDGVPPGVCATEDSAHCVWVGPVQGNGDGAIVVNLR